MVGHVTSRLSGLWDNCELPNCYKKRLMNNGHFIPNECQSESDIANNIGTVNFDNAIHSKSGAFPFAFAVRE